ncbi:MAG TPA: phospholipase D-like domain-containing protein, partial [Patescibacteria group bacterium]|nr:phospholipase D-like domain-containing protein [Patescibacteria group bacterium]
MSWLRVCTPGGGTGPIGSILPAALLLAWFVGDPSMALAASRRQSADEWRRLTATNSPVPRVLVHKNEIRFYFPTQPRPIGFSAELGRARLLTEGYQVSSALLKLKKKLPPVAPGTDGWKEPVLIVGEEWRRLSINLLAALTPATPGHAKYYRGLLGDRILYRDQFDRPSSAPIYQPPPNVVIDHRYSIEESLQILAVVAEPMLRRAHPRDSLFVMFVHPLRTPQPLVIDTARHRCIWLSSAGLYEAMEPGFPLAPTLQSVSALVFESNGLALIKNPVSSIGRLGNLLVTLCVNLARLPLPKPTGPVPPLAQTEGMNLAQWEDWLDQHTGSRREYGSLQLMIDGERFFPQLQQAISNATGHVKMHVFIFDNDDVAVEIANQLKQRSDQVRVEVLLDRMATMSAAKIPPVTPPAKSYEPPASISSYLTEGSKVQVRSFLNAFCSFDHSKVYLVDNRRAWMGGMNIGREYRSDWHDMMVEMQGPIVDSLEYEFKLDWAHAGWLGDLAFLRAL